MPRVSRFSAAARGTDLGSKAGPTKATTHPKGKNHLKKDTPPTSHRHGTVVRDLFEASGLPTNRGQGRTENEGVEAWDPNQRGNHS
jgi:hypothetical protein